MQTSFLATESWGFLQLHCTILSQGSFITPCVEASALSCHSISCPPCSKHAAHLFAYPGKLGLQRDACSSAHKKPILQLAWYLSSCPPTTAPAAHSRAAPPAAPTPAATAYTEPTDAAALAQGDSGDQLYSTPSSQCLPSTPACLLDQVHQVAGQACLPQGQGSRGERDQEGG
jgi:hypothetical protein